MSDKDTVTKEYMQDSAIFADAFNFLLYDGRQVIKPEQLRPIDTAAVSLPYGADGKTFPLQRQRDVLKTVVAMEDDRAAYLLLGIENQSQIHYAMPVRNMLYDAMQYAAQVDEISKSHRIGGAAPQTGAEFLSGLYETDRLLPIITLTVYFGADKWTAPADLHGMLSADKEILRFVDNYHLHLIVPADIADNDFGKFRTELSLALKYLKYSKDKIKLYDMVSGDKAFRNVSRNTANLVNTMTNSKLKYAEGKERIDMCEAIEGLMNDAMAIGLEKGRVEGRAEGLEEGIEKGVERGQYNTLYGLVRSGLLNVKDAAAYAGISVEEFEKRTNPEA